MKREDFQSFVNKTIEEVIQVAEMHCGEKLSRKIVFGWFSQKSEFVFEDVSEHITEKVYLSENEIFPCVDIGVFDVLEDKSLLIGGFIAGYSPKPFGLNWKGEEGPFIKVIGEPFYSKYKR